MSKQNESEHTPGPWQIGPSQLGNISCVLKAGHGHICDRPYGNGDGAKSWNANARLIAAAPDMLAACEQALERLEQHHRRLGMYGDDFRAVENLTAAIARAKGE